ncbi:hypothetical protein [Streptomyces sp. NPDC005498]|uniref:hypothetical protein n=1 Tax=Streptomyces sp. NPDC005498 TaxID=3364717 RepID=UPI0036872B59
MRTFPRALASAAVTVAAVGTITGTAAGPVAAAIAVEPGAPGYVTFWAGPFSGPTLEYSPAQAGTSCVTLPFSVQADLNYSYQAVVVYTGTGCTDTALTLPAGDLHSFGGLTAGSFRFGS